MGLKSGSSEVAQLRAVLLGQLHIRHCLNSCFLYISQNFKLTYHSFKF